MDSNKQNLINKILYRAQYRGTKEMDIFVSKFVNSIIGNLDHKELVSLDKLINFDDETLVNLSLGKDSKNFEDAVILKKLIEFKNKYSLTDGLTINKYNNIINEVLKELPDLDEWLNDDIKKKYKYNF